MTPEQEQVVAKLRTEFNFQVQTMDLTPTAVRMRLREEPVEPLPQSIFISQKRGTEPA